MLRDGCLSISKSRGGVLSNQGDSEDAGETEVHGEPDSMGSRLSLDPRTSRGWELET